MRLFPQFFNLNRCYFFLGDFRLKYGTFHQADIFIAFLNKNLDKELQLA